MRLMGTRQHPVRSPLLRRWTEALRDVAWLDRAGDPLRDTIVARIPDGTRAVLRGRWLGHSLHPPMTDVPVGFWFSAVTLDVLGGADHEAAADRLVLLGIATSLPTAAAGLLDWAESSRASRRQGLVHAAANVVALGLFVSSARARARDQRRRGRRLAGVAVIVLGASTYLGGHLAYAEGVGVDPRAALERASTPIG